MSFTEMIQYILYIVLTAILPVAAKYTVNFIQARIRESAFIEEAAKTEARSILIKDALSDVMDAVLYVNQTFVDTLKARGEFTQSAWEEAKQKAYNAALLSVSEESKKAVASVYGSFDNWLQLKIEASVQAAKTNNTRM
ncbi:MAG: hypothetical protein HFI55_15025 [Lachnospiraceae bacterium]|jgi:hypothetical protein|nr:hypothetical protein [Lachnospiraceae bacterium]